MTWKETMVLGLKMAAILIVGDTISRAVLGSVAYWNDRRKAQKDGTPCDCPRCNPQLWARALAKLEPMMSPPIGADVEH